MEHFWYYIVQRKGPNDIIDLVKFETYEEAIESARQVLAAMNRAAASTLKCAQIFERVGHLSRRLKNFKEKFRTAFGREMTREAGYIG